MIASVQSTGFCGIYGPEKVFVIDILKYFPLLSIDINGSYMWDYNAVLHLLFHTKWDFLVYMLNSLSHSLQEGVVVVVVMVVARLGEEVGAEVAGRSRHTKADTPCTFWVRKRRLWPFLFTNIFIVQNNLKINVITNMLATKDTSILCEVASCIDGWSHLRCKCLSVYECQGKLKCELFCSRHRRRLL